MPRGDPAAADDAALREASDGFFLAAEHGRSDVIKALADHSEGRVDFARIVDPATGRTPVHVAVLNRKTDALRVLLAEGFPPHLETFVTPPPSSGAGRGEKRARTAYALALEAKAHDLVFVFHQFAIQQVAMNSVDGVDQLLRAGVPVDMTDGVAQGNTLLHWAVTCRALDVAQYLVAEAARQSAHLVDCTNAEGATPLHVACRDGQMDFVRLLLENGANPRCTGTSGAFRDKTPLDLVTSTEIRTLVTSYTERPASLSVEASQTTDKASEERKAGGTTESEGSTSDEMLVALRRKHALQMEEKDLLIRQLKATIEALVVESQEIRKLGEERTMLNYVRKLREEKEVVKRQLEDAEDHIRIQQRQIQELKHQIRGMQSNSVPAIHQSVPEHEPFQPEQQSPRAAKPTDHSRDTQDQPQRPAAVPTPPRSQSGAWSDVWNVLWGNDLQAEAVDSDGEVIMTV